MMLFKNYLFVVLSLCSGLSCAQVELPNDITFGIVDLKFDGKQVKICEMGEGLISGFKGYYAYHPQSFLWEKILKNVSSFNVPVYLVAQDNRLFSDLFCKKNNVKLCNNASSMFSLLDSLSHPFEVKNYKKIEDYQGIIALKGRPHRGLLMKEYNFFGFNFHNFILVGRYSHYFFMDKAWVDTFIFKDDPVLASFRPRCSIYSTTYSSLLVHKINKDIQSDMLVIKPLNSGHGDGIVFTKKENLDQVLKILFSKEKVENDLIDADIISFWKKHADKDLFFLVEEFIESKSINVENKNYDPTARVMFIAYCSNQQISINIIDGYWKLPVKSLEEQGSFSELHKSKVGKNRVFSALINKDDFEKIYSALAWCLPRIYEKMLVYGVRHEGLGL